MEQEQFQVTLSKAELRAVIKYTIDSLTQSLMVDSHQPDKSPTTIYLEDRLYYLKGRTIKVACD